METLSVIHAKMLHVIYLLAALGIVFPLINKLRKQPLHTVSLWAVRVYTFVITIQFLIGILQLAARWGDYGDGLRYRLEHALIMFVAVGCVHMAPRFIKRGDAIGARNTTFLMVASLALVILGATLIQRAAQG